MADTQGQPPANPPAPGATPVDPHAANVQIVDVIHLRNFSAVPILGNVGDLVCVAGVLYICTAANTFTKVGTQT